MQAGGKFSVRKLLALNNRSKLNSLQQKFHYEQQHLNSEESREDQERLKVNL